MNTFPYIILLKGKLFVIELPERPQTKSWMSAGECGCFVNTSCACMDWANARCAAIEKAVEIENPEVVTNVFQLEMSNKRVLVEGEEVRWPGTWEHVLSCNTCDMDPKICYNQNIKDCALTSTVARLIAPEPFKTNQEEEDHLKQFTEKPEPVSSETQEELVREIAAIAWKGAANAFRMYPENKHTFTEYWSSAKDQFKEFFTRNS